MDVRAEIQKILSIVRELPENLGNHELYRVYRHDGGNASWKMFRRAVALMRGGAEADAESARMDREEAALIKIDKDLIERDRVREEHKAERERTEREKRERAEKEKQMATIRREDLQRGQDVWVRVRYGEHLKLRPARVNDVMRGAVNVTINGETNPRTVRFNEIELSREVMDREPTQMSDPSLTAVPTAFAALAEGRGVRAVEVRAPVVERRHGGNGYAQVAQAVKPPEPVKVPPPPPPPPPENTIDQVAAWIQQGSAMRDNLLKQQATLQSEMDELALEALKIEETLTSKRTELARLTSLLTALDQMRAAAA